MQCSQMLRFITVHRKKYLNVDMRLTLSTNVNLIFQMKANVMSASE